MELTIDVDLALGNVAGEIGNGVSDVWMSKDKHMSGTGIQSTAQQQHTVVGHGKNGNLRNGSVASADTTGTLWTSSIGQTKQRKGISAKRTS